MGCDISTPSYAFGVVLGYLATGIPPHCAEEADSMRPPYHAQQIEQGSCRVLAELYVACVARPHLRPSMQAVSSLLTTWSLDLEVNFMLRMNVPNMDPHLLFTSDCDDQVSDFFQHLPLDDAVQIDSTRGDEQAIEARETQERNIANEQQQQV